MLLMIDNYDSFTYNLVQYFGELGEDVRVFRNNKISIDEIEFAGSPAASSFLRGRAHRRKRASRSKPSGILAGVSRS